MDALGLPATTVVDLADAYVAEFLARFPYRAELQGLSVERHDPLWTDVPRIDKEICSANAVSWPVRAPARAPVRVDDALARAR